MNSRHRIQQIKLEDNSNTANDSRAGEGYFLEVDLQYPNKLHDWHQDFVLAHTKEEVSYKILGEK